MQELIAKRQALSGRDGIRWHFIGHLQTNKVRALVGQADLIESIDSERLMGMATNTDDWTRVADDFRLVAALRDRILTIAPDLRGFDTLSMGMSDDYPLAIAAGSTMVRVGTAIFGQRDYHKP